MQIDPLKPIVEAALLTSSQPLSLVRLRHLFEADPAVDHARLRQVLQALAADCAGRGIELVEVASGYRYQVRTEIHAQLSPLWSEKPARYSRALLETLSLIAYRQPITRPEVEQIRGVTVSSQIMKTLEEREWVHVVGHRDSPGRPALYGTTRAFLDHFNLKSLDQLPTLAEIRDQHAPLPNLDDEARTARVDPDLTTLTPAMAASGAAITADPLSTAATDPVAAPAGAESAADQLVIQEHSA